MTVDLSDHDRPHNQFFLLSCGLVVHLCNDSSSFLIPVSFPVRSDSQEGVHSLRELFPLFASSFPCSLATRREPVVSAGPITARGLPTADDQTPPLQIVQDFVQRPLVPVDGVMRLLKDVFQNLVSVSRSVPQHIQHQQIVCPSRQVLMKLIRVHVMMGATGTHHSQLRQECKHGEDDECRTRAS